MSEEISQHCIQNRKLWQSYPKHPCITCVHCSRKQRGTHLPCEICKQEAEGRKCKVVEITRGAITKLRHEDVQTVELRPSPRPHRYLMRKKHMHVKFWYSVMGKGCLTYSTWIGNTPHKSFVQTATWIRMLRKAFGPKCFMTCTPHRVLFGWSNQEEWDGRVMWHLWGRWEVPTGFWWENPRERDHFEGTGVDGRIILKWIFKK